MKVLRDNSILPRLSRFFEKRNGLLLLSPHLPFWLTLLLLALALSFSLLSSSLSSHLLLFFSSTKKPFFIVMISLSKSIYVKEKRNLCCCNLVSHLHFIWSCLHFIWMKILWEVII